jgi:glycoprotein endo-alpha-1,2-mannosidase
VSSAREAIVRTVILRLLLTAGLAAASLSSFGLPPDELYPVDVVLATTSDWTNVRLIGATLAVDSYEVIEGAEATNLTISAGATLAVNKAVLDETPVTVRFRGYLAELSASWMQIGINKGHLGETTVAILPRGRSGFDPLVRFTHSGVVPGSPPENVRTFSFRASAVTLQIEPMIVPAPSASSVGGQKVLAFYYPWYGTPDGPAGRWVHWDPSRAHHASTHVPAAGYYDSLDPETVRRHIREAKAAGIDGFIASWWGLSTFEDRAFGILLDVAEEEDFLATIYYEDAQASSQIITDVSTIVSRYTSSPAFLKVEGRPVIFFYVRVTAKFSLSQWESVFTALHDRGKSIFAIADGLEPEFLGVFQGVHTYNPVSVPLEETAETYRSVSLAARVRGDLFAATVLPGYEEAVPRSDSPTAQRADGETYRAYWAVARASKPHWILITSFNEWHEGSEIEPSVEFGRFYLQLTAEQAALWRAGEDPSSDTTGDDRDGDGVPDADDYCPDWPGSGETDGC